MARIVILGAGFGGVAAASILEKSLKEEDTIMLISKSKNFVFIPLLHEVSTGLLSPEAACIPISNLIKSETVDSEVTAIDFSKKTVHVGSRLVQYDYLLIALGSTPNLSILPKDIDPDKFFLLKNLAHAVRIKKRLHELVAQSSGRVRRPVTILLLGAGSTGIELAGEIRNFFDRHFSRLVDPPRVRIILIQNLANILLDKPSALRISVKRQLSNLGVEIIYNANLLSCKGNVAVVQIEGKQRAIPYSMIIFTAGVIPVPIDTVPKIPNEKGGFEVDEYLQVKGVEDVWAVGDIAHCINPLDNKPVPMLAQAANSQGHFVAGNILAKMQGKSQRRYVFRSKGFIISVGKGYAVGEVYGWIHASRLMWLLKRTIYAAESNGLKNKLRMLWRLSIKSIFKK